jgi:hypothetical protein
MKTTKTIAALSIAMILFAFSAFAGKTDGQKGNLKYVVNIHLPKLTTIPHATFYVLVTDANNHPVDAVQTFIPGNSTYTFTEMGPVTGVRIAWILQGGTFARIPLYDNSDILKGTFLPGRAYQFDIYPKVGKPE